MAVAGSLLTGGAVAEGYGSGFSVAALAAAIAKVRYPGIPSGISTARPPAPAAEPLAKIA